MAKAKKMDTKILIIAVVLVLAAVLVLFGGDLPGLTTTTTTIASQTTTTIAPTTTTTVAGDTCDDLCLAADYSQGTCRPACLGYEIRSDDSGSDCADIQKCCCKR